MQLKLTIEDNIADISRELRKVRQKFPKSLDTTTRDVARAVKSSLQRQTPTQTNKLKNSYFVRKVRNSDYLISNNARSRGGFEYIDALEFGTGIHGPKRRVIRPKSKKALRFKDIGRRGSRGLGISPRRGSGKIIFAKFVRGIKAFGMFKKTKPKIPAIARVIINARLRALIRKFNEFRSKA